MNAGTQARKAAYQRQQAGRKAATADLQARLQGKVNEGGTMADFWQELLDESMENHGNLLERG